MKNEAIEDRGSRIEDRGSLLHWPEALAREASSLANASGQCEDRGSRSSIFHTPSSILASFFILHSSFFILLLPSTALGVDNQNEPELDALLPVGNRPESFSGAIGRFQQITATAKPMQVRVEEPLVLTVRITAADPVLQAPVRPDLRQVPGFTEQFYIEDGPPSPEEEESKLAWEFIYVLKPRDAGVHAVPALPFSFFNSDFLKPGAPVRSRGYETKYADEIPLVVIGEPAGEPPGLTWRLASEPPFSAYHLAPVRLHEKPVIPLLPLIAATFLLPSLACAGWFVVWRHRYPDAVASARRRRSRAGKRALKALQSEVRDQRSEIRGQRSEIRGQKSEVRSHFDLGPRTSDQAATAAGILAEYLRQRLDLLVVDPTPAEAAAILAHSGFPAALAEQTEQFFRSCDSIRFAPPTEKGNSLLFGRDQRSEIRGQRSEVRSHFDLGPLTSDLMYKAERLVLALEAEPAPRQPAHWPEALARDDASLANASGQCTSLTTHHSPTQRRGDKGAPRIHNFCLPVSLSACLLVSLSARRRSATMTCWPVPMPPSRKGRTTGTNRSRLRHCSARPPPTMNCWIAVAAEAGSFTITSAMPAS